MNKMGALAKVLMALLLLCVTGLVVMARHRRREGFALALTLRPMKVTRICAEPGVPWPEAVSRAATLYPARVRLHRGPAGAGDWEVTDAWTARRRGASVLAQHADVEKVFVVTTDLPGASSGADPRNPPDGWPRPLRVEGAAALGGAVGDLGGALALDKGPPAHARVRYTWYRPQAEPLVTVSGAAGFVHYLDSATP